MEISWLVDVSVSLRIIASSPVDSCLKIQGYLSPSSLFSSHFMVWYHTLLYVFCGIVHTIPSNPY